MWVKVPPTRLRYDSLSAHTDRTRFSESEAGDRAQSDNNYGLTLVLTGSSYGETEPKKATQSEAGHSIQNPDYTGANSRLVVDNRGKSLGNPVVEVATPNGTNNLTEGTNKNEPKVKGKVEPLVG